MTTANPFLLENADYAVSSSTKIAPFIRVRHLGFLLAERAYVQTSVDFQFLNFSVPLHQKLVLQ